MKYVRFRFAARGERASRVHGRGIGSTADTHYPASYQRGIPLWISLVLLPPCPMPLGWMRMEKKKKKSEEGGKKGGAQESFSGQGFPLADAVVDPRCARTYSSDHRCDISKVLGPRIYVSAKRLLPIPFPAIPGLYPVASLSTFRVLPHRPILPCPTPRPSSHSPSLFLFRSIVIMETIILPSPRASFSIPRFAAVHTTVAPTEREEEPTELERPFSSLSSISSSFRSRRTDYRPNRAHRPFRSPSIPESLPPPHCPPSTHWFDPLAVFPPVYLRRLVRALPFHSSPQQSPICLNKPPRQVHPRALRPPPRRGEHTGAALRSPGPSRPRSLTYPRRCPNPSTFIDA